MTVSVPGLNGTITVWCNNTLNSIAGDLFLISKESSRGKHGCQECSLYRSILLYSDPSN